MSSARHVIVEGVVQGVGFRPFVYGTANRHRLSGWVRNTAIGVEIEVEGEAVGIHGFLDDLERRAPPLARIEKIESTDITPRGRSGFRIDPSADEGGFLPVSADVATCDACLGDVHDPANRRFRYPFTNCTNCGPRFTIVRSIPYDRPNTTMAGFRMCAACQREYDDPADRRFHAEPNACPECGPALELVDAARRPIDGDPLALTSRLLAAGEIVAIKGIGGFHLACDARKAAAVRRLRRRKEREGKPFALMAATLDEVQRISLVTGEEQRLLESPARPIVILRERADSGIAPSVAHPLRELGIMLPYSPLHHLLFAEGECPRALVLTSGNRAGEPIARDEAEALERLSDIADALLLHDRPIEVRCDDSVTRVAAGDELPIRRSRGYAPYPVRLPFEAPPLLACGADLKTTICVARGRHAFLSPHVGDLEDADTWRSYSQMVAHMEAVFRIRPEAIVHDLHPDYLSTRFATEAATGAPRVAVQHHHAHVASCMAEHGLDGEVIGVAFDGTGYGTDGTVWGGEFLVAGYASFRRAGHLGTVAMPGGARAIREPFRMAFAHARHAGIGIDLPVSAEEIEAIEWQIARGVNAPLTSSIGRLFDAVASLAGVRHRALYEGQAAMELEARVAPGEFGAYPFPIDGRGLAAGWIADPRPLVTAVVEDRRRGVAPAIIAARFHESVARLVAEMCGRIREETELSRVVLGGGVFQNATLLGRTLELLRREAFDSFRHRIVPPNDAGIALGQAAIAAARLRG